MRLSGSTSYLAGVMALSLFFAAAPNLQAQIVCTGDVCDDIGITQAEYDQMYYEFQEQYTNDLFSDMAEAAVIAGLMGAPTGRVNLQGWTFGASLGAAYKEGESKDINIPNVGTFEDVDSAGAAATGRFFLGFNFGNFIGRDFDPFEEDPDGGTPRAPSWYHPARFDIYLSGIKHTERYSDENGVDGSMRATLRGEGVEIRYHLVEGSEIFGGPLLRFHGVSLSAGYYNSRQKITATRPENDIAFATSDGINLSWVGNDAVRMETEIRSYPIELRTGIQLLYLLNLSVGVGQVWSTGNVNFTMIRFGPILFADATLASQSYDSNGNPRGYYSLTLQEEARVPPRIQYGRAGLELNLLNLKVGVEAVATKNAYGAGVSMRFEF